MIEINIIGVFNSIIHEIFIMGGFTIAFWFLFRLIVNSTMRI